MKQGPHDPKTTILDACSPTPMVVPSCAAGAGQGGVRIQYAVRNSVNMLLNKLSAQAAEQEEGAYATEWHSPVVDDNVSHRHDACLLELLIEGNQLLLIAVCAGQVVQLARHVALQEAQFRPSQTAAPAKQQERYKPLDVARRLTVRCQA